MKVRNIILGGCLLAGLSFTSCDKDDDEEVNQRDRDFMTKAAISNTAEVDAATLALTKATDSRVKSFAQHMVAEHSLAQTDLKSLGNAVGHPIADTLDPAHVTIKAQLMALSGRAFDSAYMHVQVMDHQMTLENFRSEENNGRHRDVKGYANRYRPHIEMHLIRADSIANNLFKR